MAQSLCLTAPPFCLACIGSDNKFTAQHVMLRWKHIYEECTKRGLLVLSFGGDGDSSIMDAMKQFVSLMSASKEPLLQSIPSSSLVPRISATWKEWFCVHPRLTVSYVQDVVHVGVKLKSRLLKPSILLPVGQISLLVETTFKWFEWHMVKINTISGSVILIIKTNKILILFCILWLQSTC